MKRLVLLFALASPAASLTAGAPPKQIDVLTDTERPIINVGEVQKRLNKNTIVRTFRIDAQARLEEKLSKDLPANPDKARAIALQRIQTLDPSRLAQELSGSFEALLLAQRYGIDRYPAVVFDGGKRVVYGVTDLREAVHLYERSAIRTGE